MNNIMNNIQTRLIAIFAALAALMAATRFNHFGSAVSLPDASYAVFFLGGLYLAGFTRASAAAFSRADHRSGPDRLLRDFRSGHQRLVHESRLLVPDTDIRQLVAGWPLVRVPECNARAQPERKGMDRYGRGRMGGQQLRFRVFQCHLLSVFRSFRGNERDGIRIACCPILCLVCFNGPALYCLCNGPAHGCRNHQQAKGAFTLIVASGRYVTGLLLEFAGTQTAQA